MQTIKEMGKVDTSRAFAGLARHTVRMHHLPERRTPPDEGLQTQGRLETAFSTTAEDSHVAYCVEAANPCTGTPQKRTASLAPQTQADSENSTKAHGATKKDPWGRTTSLQCGKKTEQNTTTTPVARTVCSALHGTADRCGLPAADVTASSGYPARTVCSFLHGTARGSEHDQ